MLLPKQDDDEQFGDLTIPDFKSSIPEYLANGLEPKERHVLEALSIIAQKQDFLFNVIIEERNLMRIVKRRTNRYEKFILILTSKWSVVFYLIALLYPIVSSILVRKLGL